VLYESPHRLRKTLEDLLEVYGPHHPVAVARELTKLHEEVYRGTLEGALAHFQEPRGEFVLVLAPKEEAPPEGRALLEALKGEGLRGKALVKALMERGLSRNEAYRLAMEEE
jgi:16S rRNA (cytidine1402-2'-O)-methyltransferase